MNRVVVALVAVVLLSLMSSCSSQKSDLDSQESSGNANPLAELTFASDSTDAYNRACYWGSQGDNIFMLQRIQEGNELAEQEGKLPVLGVEQAMSVVLQKGEPGAPKEYEIVRGFCESIGIPLND